MQLKTIFDSVNHNDFIILWDLLKTLVIDLEAKIQKADNPENESLKKQLIELQVEKDQLAEIEQATRKRIKDNILNERKLELPCVCYLIESDNRRIHLCSIFKFMKIIQQ